MAVPPIPTILTYEKSSAPSLGLMSAKTFKGEVFPVAVDILYGRGAQSTHSAGHGEVDTELGEWMPLRMDICQLPHNADNLVIQFPLKYLPRSLTPHSCNNPEWTELLEELCQVYGEKRGYLYQAYCQIDALFQGLPFWRNNQESDAMTLSIINLSDKVFPPYEFSGLPCAADQLTGTNKFQFDSLIRNIEKALIGERRLLRLFITAALEIGRLEEVHPSEEFIEKLPEAKKEFLHRRGKYQKSRHYAFYRLGDIRQAMLHPTKIGAGLRWDRWNKLGTDIPVSVYGLDSKSHRAIRAGLTHEDNHSHLSRYPHRIYTYSAALPDSHYSNQPSCAYASYFLYRLHPY